MRRLIGPVALVAALLLCVAALVGPASAARAAAVPTVSAGGSLALDVGGFAAGSAVTVQLAGSTTGRQLTHADRRGHVRLSYRVPTVLGRYHLLVSGPARAKSSPTQSPTPASGGGDLQVISVTVPLVLNMPFRVGGSGVDAVSVHSGGPGLGSGSGALADTGVDIRAPLILAAMLGLIGCAATLAGRRRARA